MSTQARKRHTPADEPAPLHALRAGLPDRYLTPDDLVTLLQLPSVETVYRWRKQRNGPPGFRVGKHLRFDPAQVAVWVADQTGKETA